MEKSGYGKDGIFRSLRPSIKLPRDENVSMVSFMFRDSLSYAHKLALADADSGEKLSFRDFKDKGYGLTESCGIATLAFPKEGNSHFGSAGTLVPGLEAKIVNLETGKSLPPNQRGEVWLRGPNIMIGYFNNPSATKMTLDNEGWLHTGDMGYFDEEGGLFIVDRIKELIKYKGFQVAPAELEGLLLTHPQITDAGVIPLPDLKVGEVPIAYVVRTPGSSLSEKEVMDYVAKQVAPFKRLHRVNFVDSIPKSSSGKILRRELIAKAKSKL